MRTRVQLLALLVALAVARPAFSQSSDPDGPLTREDGIRAFVAADYGRAVAALRPLAEDAEPPDPVAQFFMGLLYLSGAGVKGDPFHACSLLLNAAETNGPFTVLASRLASEMQDGQSAQFCPREWSTEQRATFTLGPNYRVVIAPSSMTVFKDGEERTFPALENGPFGVHEPSVYTAIDITSPARARRHFVQGFSWWPSPLFNPSSWRLRWTLSEVIGLDFVTVAAETGVLTVESASSPTDVDLAHVATVRTNAAGQAEWSVGAGPAAKGGVIPWVSR